MQLDTMNRVNSDENCRCYPGDETIMKEQHNKVIVPIDIILRIKNSITRTWLIKRQDNVEKYWPQYRNRIRASDEIDVAYSISNIKIETIAIHN